MAEHRRVHVPETGLGRFWVRWFEPLTVGVAVFWFAGLSPYLFTAAEGFYLLAGIMVGLLFAGVVRFYGWESEQRGYSRGHRDGLRVGKVRTMIDAGIVSRAQARRLMDPGQTGAIDIIRAERSMQQRKDIS